MTYREIYCKNCKRALGKYNAKYFSDHRLGELLNDIDSMHIKHGHDITIKSKE